MQLPLRGRIIPSICDSTVDAERAVPWCPMKSMHGDVAHMDQVDITFSCFATHDCNDTCPGWDIDDVTLPGSFFIPSRP